MRARGMRASPAAIARLADELHERWLALDSDERAECIGSDLSTVNRALSRVRDQGIARGPVFCEWGSGMGGVCAVAALNGLTPVGIEIQPELVESARSLALELDLSMTFAEGTFLLPGDEDLVVTSALQTRLEFCDVAWNATGLAHRDCDIVFAYPWPGEERFVDSVFARHASPDALLLTFHDFDRVLAQRKSAHVDELLTYGWL